MQVLTISDIIDANPDLSSYGWRFTQRSEDTWNDGTAFDQWRQSMLTDDFAREVETASAWIKAHHLKPNDGSYWLKHQVEKWGATEGLSSYVTNGAMICAALLQGFAAIRSVNSPNCHFSRSAKQ